jgi:hypothetical protein
MQRNTIEWADPANMDKGVIIKIPGSAPVTITKGAEIDVALNTSMPQGVMQHVKVTVIGWANWGGVYVPRQLYYEPLTPVLAYKMHRPAMEVEEIMSIRLHPLRMDPNDDPQFQAARRQFQADEARRRAAEAADRNIRYGIPMSQTQIEAETRRRSIEQARRGLPKRGAGNVLKKRYYYSKKRSTRRSKSLRRKCSCRMK